MRFELVDFYEGEDTIFESDNYNDVKEYARQWDDDTDGECCLAIFKDGSLIEEVSF